MLIPLPDHDCDVTEVAVPWRVLRDAGHEVVFATERGGTVPAADPRLLTGVIFGQPGAAPDAKRVYGGLTGAAEFNGTQAWGALDPAALDGLLLPGGHAPGCGSTSAWRNCATRWPGSGRSARSAMVSWCWRGRWIRRPAAACWPAGAPRACSSTWSGRPSWRPAGGLAATTGRIPSRRRLTTRPASSSAARRFSALLG